MYLVNKKKSKLTKIKIGEVEVYYFLIIECLESNALAFE